MLGLGGRTSIEPRCGSRKRRQGRAGRWEEGGPTVGHPWPSREVVEAAQRAHACALAREGREDDDRVKTTTRQVA